MKHRIIEHINFLEHRFNLATTSSYGNFQPSRKTLLLEQNEITDRFLIKFSQHCAQSQFQLSNGFGKTNGSMRFPNYNNPPKSDNSLHVGQGKTGYSSLLTKLGLTTFNISWVP